MSFTKNPLVVQVKNLCKKYPGTVALKNVNFDVRKGEVMGVVGKNGARASMD